MHLRLLTLVFLLFTSTQVYSFNGWMNIHLGSHHLKPSYKEKGDVRSYNETNLGVGLSLPITPKLDALAGFFENSFNKTTAYAGVNYHTVNSRGFSAGLNTGVASGYEGTINSENKLLLMFIPHITYTLKNIRAEIGYIPSFGKENHTSVVVFSIGTQF